MDIQVHSIRGVKDTETNSTLLQEFVDIPSTLEFVLEWLGNNEFGEYVINWITNTLYWENHEAHFIRDNCEFRMIRYGNHSSGWYGIKVIIERS